MKNALIYFSLKKKTVQNQDLKDLIIHYDEKSFHLILISLKGSGQLKKNREKKIEIYEKIN